MSFLLNPHLDLTSLRIETDRCILVPFSLDGWVDIHELQEEFCKANKDFFVNSFLPNYEQEVQFVMNVVEQMKRGEIFENFIFEKWTHRFLWCVGINRPELHRMNIGLWIRVDEHGKWYATEVYRAFLDWARENTRYEYLKHSLDPKNEASRKLAIRFWGVLQDETDEKGSEIYHIPL